MSKATNKVIEVSLRKSDVKKDGKPWYKNVYKFEGSEQWYSHFVNEKTPLYPVGTVIKEIEYTVDQYGGNIKKLIVGNMPKPDGGDQSGAASKPTGTEVLNAIKNRLEGNYGKEHPIWMCGRWGTDLQLARMERLHPAHTDQGDTFPSLQQLADEIVTTSWFLFTKFKALIQGKGPGPVGHEEPVQEPDQEPSPSSFEDDIPF